MVDILQKKKNHFHSYNFFLNSYFYNLAIRTEIFNTLNGDNQRT